MRRISLIFFLLLTFVTSQSRKAKTITILHTNDTHSCIMPLNSNLADTMLAGRGGFLRRLEMINQERKKDPDLLLFDSGDFSQGSPYYTLFKGDVEIGFMNRMKYTAATLGNHELDYGMSGLDNICRKKNFPIVCANYSFEGTQLEGKIKPYVVLKCKGIKVGVFGISPRPDGLIDFKNYKGVVYENPIVVANKVAKELKEQKKCDIVIAISHLGWELEGIDEQDLLSQTRNIDLLLGGHSHTYFESLRYVKNLDGRDIPVNQNGKYGIYVGKVVLTVEQ